jgi:hypothetical protein
LIGNRRGNQISTEGLRQPFIWTEIIFNETSWSVTYRFAAALPVLPPDQRACRRLHVPEIIIYVIEMHKQMWVVPPVSAGMIQPLHNLHHTTERWRVSLAMCLVIAVRPFVYSADASDSPDKIATGI